MPKNSLGKWKPDENEVTRIKALTELGWAVPNICVKLKVRPDQFALALEDNSELKQIVTEAEEFRKLYPVKRLEWRPSDLDLPLVEEYAKEGLPPNVIAAKIGASRDTFKARLLDTPQLTDAYEKGQALYQETLINKANTMLKQNHEDLKFTSSLHIFMLKAHCGFSDKPESAPPPQKLEVSGKVNHQHSLKSPEPVATVHIEDYAKKEMERASVISAEKLRLLPAVEAEVDE